MKTTLAALGFLLVAWPVSADQAEKPETKKPGRPAKVYTDEDLRTARGNVAAPGSEFAATPEANEEKRSAEDEASAKEPTEEERREGRRNEIQAQIDDHRSRIAQLRKDMDRAQRELNDLTTYTFASPGEKKGRRAAMMQLLEDAQKLIKTSEEAIADLEEQARRQGVRVSGP